MTCNNFPTTPKKGCDVMQMLPIRTYNWHQWEPFSYYWLDCWETFMI
jgi:hypothetical protein